MATVKSNNIVIDPNAGESGLELAITSETPNTGRNERVARFVLSGTGDYATLSVTTKNLVVTQAGRAEFISLPTTSAPPVNFPATQGDITFSGTSNLEYLKLSFGDQADATQFKSAVINDSTPMTQVTDFTTGLGYSSGLGATSAYPVAFTFTIPANTGADRTFTYKFTVNESTTDFQVKQLGASSSISFSASSANVDADGGYDGTAISVNAPEGVTWEITPNNS